MPGNPLENLLEKCAIYYGDALISKEDILRQYARFFADALSGQDKRVSFALHTGSRCFDIISIVSAALGVFTYNLPTNDDILAALNIDDMVVYENNRYRWKGTTIEENRVLMVLEQDGRGLNGPLTHKLSYEVFKHAVKPYYGKSAKTDGRGIRRRKTNRENFLSYVCGIPVSDVPAEIDSSVVIVADRVEFSDICRNLCIKYDSEKQIGLLDIIPASYYTSNGTAFQFGSNPTKAEAVLKVARDVDTARRLVSDKTGKKVVGLLVSNVASLVNDGGVLRDLLRPRKSPRFIHITSPMRAELCENILSKYSDYPVFACTKAFLSKNVTQQISCNALTDELYLQVKNVLHNEVKAVNIDGGMAWEEYNQLKRKLSSLIKYDWTNEGKDEFIPSAYALLNLLTTAPFSMDVLEEAIRSGKVHSGVISPYTRIQNLRQISGMAGSLKEICNQIVDDLELQYIDLETSSPKGDFMRQRIEAHSGANIAIVLPKAYYADVIAGMPWFSDLPEPKPTLTTVKKFNIGAEYDYILVVGDSKEFNAFQCYTAKIIDILLYDCEEKTFRQKQQQAERLSRQLNRCISLQKGEVYEEEIPANDAETSEEIDNILSETSELEQYMENIRTSGIKKLLSRATQGSDGTASSEVSFVGVFTTGEGILFSRFYSPIVFDPNAGTVTETSVDKLSPGDSLVFTTNNDYTHNIVDCIYDRLISLQRFDEKIIDATEKAGYWKEALREYRDKKGYTFQTLAQELGKYGSSLKPITIRQWLAENSHVIGPRDENTFEQIAKLTQDSYLLADPQGHYEGCRIVRHERREILKLIAKAIKDKLSGHIPAAGSILEVVYDNVKRLSEIKEIDKIDPLDEVMTVPINLVNRPISEWEGYL